MDSFEEIFEEISSFHRDWEERGERRRSGYIDPTDEERAQEEGSRMAFEEVSSSLKDLLVRAEHLLKPGKAPSL